LGPFRRDSGWIRGVAGAPERLPLPLKVNINGRVGRNLIISGEHF